MLDKKVIIALAVSGAIVASMSTVLIINGTKKKDNTNNNSSTSDIPSGLYFIANGGKLNSLNAYDGKDVAITTFIATPTTGQTFVDFSFDKYTPFRNGYTFDGWYSDPLFTESSRMSGKISVPSEAMKIYAKWKEEDLPSKYGYELSTTYCTIYGLASFDETKDYDLYFPSYIEGYPVRYISSNQNYTSFSRSNIKSIKLPEELSYLYGNSFMSTSITSVSIPKNVTVIGSNAFSSCKSLASITFEENSKLQTISSNAFTNDSSLVNIELPDTVTSISDFAFSECTSLEQINIPTNLTTIGKRIINNTIAENNLNKTEDYVFLNDKILYDFTGLGSEVSIPETVETIASGVFENNTNITKVNFGTNNNLKRLNTRTFYNCTNLTNDIVLPSSIEMIGTSSFYKVPGNIDASKCKFSNNSIPSQAFEYSEAKQILIPSDTTTIKSYAFRNCTKLLSFTIPSNVSSIQSSAFYGCSSLKEITLPKGVTTIQSSVFEECRGLEKIVLSDTIGVINQKAFKNCVSLNSINLGSQLTKIGDYAFSGCSSLTSLEISGDSKTFTSLGNDAFDGFISSQKIKFTNMTEKEVNATNKAGTCYIDNETKECNWKYNCNATIEYK